MTTLQWRPQVNALTKPLSYRPQFVPRGTAGYEELATDLSAAHPNYNADLVRSLAPLIMDWVQQRMINGWQVTFEDAFTFRPTLSGRMAGPDDPLPIAEDTLQVSIYASRPFIQKVRQTAQLERLPMAKKLPLITATEDTVLKLNDVLNPNGALHLVGSDLLFEQADEDSGCVLEGTRSGRKVQSRYTLISNTEITFLPDIPAQNDPWNNEYILSVNTHYTENGTLRTGIYERRLRTPLTATKLGHPNPPEIGILTDKAAAPYVKLTGGALSADETVRVQVILDLHDSSLSFNLLDMTEGGKAGAEVKVTANGPVMLSGFSGSALTSLNLNVTNYADLMKMVRSGYSGRLIDVLDVRV